jgi:hypothetical protein
MVRMRMQTKLALLFVAVIVGVITYFGDIWILDRKATQRNILSLFPFFIDLT